MTYNMTAFESSTNILGQFAAVNALSGNLLVILALLSLFLVLVVRLIAKNPPAESFTAASAVCTILSLAFVIADLCGIIWVIGFGMVFAVSATAMYLNNKT